MILKNSSKLILPFGSKSSSSRRSIASYGSRPKLFIIVYKSFTFTTPVLSLSNISNMHLKFSISSSEYCWKILNSSALISELLKILKLNKFEKSLTYFVTTRFFHFQCQLHLGQWCMCHLLGPEEVLSLEWFLHHLDLDLTHPHHLRLNLDAVQLHLHIVDDPVDYSSSSPHSKNHQHLLQETLFDPNHHPHHRL